MPIADRLYLKNPDVTQYGHVVAEDRPRGMFTVSFEDDNPVEVPLGVCTGLLQPQVGRELAVRLRPTTKGFIVLHAWVPDAVWLLGTSKYVPTAEDQARIQELLQRVELGKPRRLAEQVASSLRSLGMTVEDLLEAFAKLPVEQVPRRPETAWQRVKRLLRRPRA